MKFGINLYLWADDMHDGLMPVLQKLKKIGYDGVEVPIFGLDPAKWKVWARRLDDLGLERTANTVIAPEHNPVSADPKIREAAYRHMQGVVDSCATVGSSILCGPHQVALGVFTGKGATEDEWKRSVEPLRRHPPRGQPDRPRAHLRERPRRTGNRERRLGRDVRRPARRRLRRLAHGRGVRKLPPEPRGGDENLAAAVRQRGAAGHRRVRLSDRQDRRALSGSGNLP